MATQTQIYDSNLSTNVINSDSSGNTTLVTAITNKLVKVYKIFLVVGGATNLTFYDGSTALCGPLPMLSNGSLVLDFDGDPWFIGSAGNAFILNSSNAVQLSGTVYYLQTYPSVQNNW